MYGRVPILLEPSKPTLHPTLDWFTIAKALYVNETTFILHSRHVHRRSFSTFLIVDVVAQQRKALETDYYESARREL